MNRLYLTVTFCSLVFSSIVVASDVRERLLGYEWSIDEIGQLGTADISELLQIAADDNEPGFVRHRAAAMLTRSPTDEVWQLYLTGITQRDDRIARRRMVDNLCATFSNQRDEDVFKIVAPLLDENDPHLRLASVRCLNSLNDAPSKAALETYASKPMQSWERQAAGLVN